VEGTDSDTQARLDENLLVVVAVEGYSRRHQLSARDTFDAFEAAGVIASIRRHSRALRTQALEESIDFAEDILARAGA
jgi:hypothetical protein